jgi:hypothetical protein
MVMLCSSIASLGRIDFGKVDGRNISSQAPILLITFFIRIFSNDELLVARTTWQTPRRISRPRY